MIRVLDSYLINQIAAGEVIERPSSVIKELVENSIDANSTSIIIEVQGGGLTYIRVSDDGEGMDESDSILSFERHATSKISSGKDLEKVRSLGFRGEALASISAVSQVEMYTKTLDTDTGTKIVNHGGRIISNTGFACSKGTTVIVRNLFYNVPARLKFMRSTRTETSAISELISKLILSRPDIAFKYFYENKLLMSSTGEGDLLSAVKGIYGPSVENEVLQIEEQSSSDISINGLIGKSSLAKKNRNSQSFFVNGRFIKNFMISSALSEGYKSYLLINTFPWAVLQIDINPDLVDVNVHPGKTQARFKDERQVYRAVLNSIKKTLNEYYNDVSFIETNNDNRDDNIIINRTQIQYQFPTSSLERIEEKFTKYRQENEFKLDHNLEISLKKDIKHDGLNSEVKSQKAHILGAAFNTYVIAQLEEDLFLVDQHAAHERMLFEKYKDELAFHKILSQGLIAPILIEIERNEQDYISEVILDLQKIGFDIEFFDQNSIIIRGIPHLLAQVDFKSFFDEALESVQIAPYKNIDNRIDRIVSLACKKAVKAKQPLSMIEMEYIIDGILNNRIPSVCPHGRPIAIRI